ncbi:MAG: VWA domain-containing protein [Anaerolineaceae bacterium]|nr:VWA domain-containing protein [Anaerolineaceae bacterium]
MTFTAPEFLYGFFLIPLLFIFLLWTQRRKEDDIARLGDPEMITRLSANLNQRGRRWKTSLWFLALSLMIIALARPVWGSEVQRIEQRGVQVMVALDVSQSMLARDLKPDRLSRAKLEITELMEHLDGDEVGLTLFSGASFILFPLTTDYATARSFLEAAQPGAISRPGTAIGDAIRTAMSGFDPRRASQKVIVLITDGEDHDEDALPAAEEAAEQNIIIYTIGFGSRQGEPIPEYNESGEVVGYKKDRQGNVVFSELNELNLLQIAQAANGQYYHASSSGSEVQELIDALGKLQQADISTQFETQGIERFQGFLLVALGAMLLIELIPDRITPRRSAGKVGGSS